MNTLAKQSILVVDDHPLFRKGVIQLIHMAEDFNIVGEASSGREAIEMAQSLSPDIILLDLDMKDMSGLEVLKVLKASEIDSRIIMLTVSDHEADVIDALRSNADGYLLKDTEPEKLITSLKNAAKGRIILSDSLTNILALALRAETRPKDADEAGLTQQERVILDHIAEGKSNKLIARELDITEGTVKVHVKNLLKKLHFRSRVEAAVWATEKKASRL